MSTFTRLTLVGSVRRAEVVVPSDEGVAAMLPQLLDLLGESPRLSPLAVSLVRVTGDQVDLALDPATQGLVDGEVLRLVRAAAAPPSPEVADVTDATAEELRVRPGRWTISTRQAVAATAAGLAAAVSGAVVAGSLDQTTMTPDAALVTAGILSVGLSAASAGVGRAGRRYASSVLLALALGACVPFALLLVVAGRTDLAEGALAALLLAWIALGAGVGIGRNDRGALAGAAAGAALTTLHLVLDGLVSPVNADAAVAVVAAVACGLLPWWAMTTSGLTGLDDAALDGVAPRRTRVRLTLDEAYRGPTWSSVAVAIAVAVSCTGLMASADGAATILAGLVLAVVALRTRSLPIATQAVALWVAVAIPLIVGVLGPWAGEAPWVAAGCALGAGILFAVLAGWRPSGQQRARLRRLGDIAELVGVLAILPVALGVFGVYGDLVSTF